MTAHPRNVVGYDGSLDQLAGSIGHMQYDQAASFVEKLADDIKRQANADKTRGRIKLAESLYRTAERLYDARDQLIEAWETCKPYMKEETPLTPSDSSKK